MRWGALLVLVGCGRVGFGPEPAPELPDEDGTHSGSRLKVIWNAFEDGRLQQSAIYDTLRDERCAVTTVGDQIYCIPRTTYVLYADAACTQKVVTPNGCAPEQYAWDGGVLHELGAEVAVANTYRLGLNGCTGPFGAATGRELGPEIALDSFAPITAVTVPGGRLAERYYESADGFRVESAPYDTTLGAVCQPGSAGTGFTCGVGGGNASYAADGGCQTRLAQYPSGAPAPKFAYYAEAGHCRLDDFRYFATDAEYLTGPVYQFIDTLGCIDSVPSQYWKLYTLGSEVFTAAMTRTMTSDPERRFQLSYYEGGGITYRNPSALQDDAFDATCWVAPATDGTKRCLPVPAPTMEVFTDATCTTPIELAYLSVWGGCVVPPTPVYATRIVGTACDAGYEMIEVGALYEGALYQGSTPATCLPFSPAVGVTFTFWRLGATVAPDTFALVTELQDP